MEKLWKILKLKIVRLWFYLNKCLVNVFQKPSVAFKNNQSSKKVREKKEREKERERFFQVKKEPKSTIEMI